MIINKGLRCLSMIQQTLETKKFHLKKFLKKLKEINTLRMKDLKFNKHKNQNKKMNKKNLIHLNLLKILQFKMMMNTIDKESIKKII